MRDFDFDQSLEYNELVKQYDKLNDLSVYIQRMEIEGEISRLDTISRLTYIIEEKAMKLLKDIEKETK